MTNNLTNVAKICTTANIIDVLTSTGQICIQPRAPLSGRNWKILVCLSCVLKSLRDAYHFSRTFTNVAKNSWRRYEVTTEGDDIVPSFFAFRKVTDMLGLAKCIGKTLSSVAQKKMLLLIIGVLRYWQICTMFNPCCRCKVTE